MTFEDSYFHIERVEDTSLFNYWPPPCCHPSADCQPDASVFGWKG